MDKLTLKGMSFHANHGLFPEEKAHGNSFEVDLVFYLNLQDAGNSDDLKETIDYGKAHTIVQTIMNGPAMGLIEALAFSIGEKLFEEFTPDQLVVSVRKLNPPVDGTTQYSEVQMKWPR